MSPPAVAFNATLADVLPAGLRLGEPDIVGALAVYPIFGVGGQAKYALLADALSQGASLREVEPPNVNRLRLDAPSGVRVLLFAGEEVVGAKQNRIVNATVVVAGPESAEIPVSCIEHGRWSRGGERGDFASSSQVAYTSLRGTVNQMVGESRIRGRSYDTDQGRVWSEVAKKTTQRGVQSATGAMTAIFDAERPSVERSADTIRVRDGQLGLLAFMGGRFLALDLVSRADAWRSLHARVACGHAMEALGVAASLPVSSADAAGVLSRVAALSTTSAAPPTGIGFELRAEASGMHGAGVVLDGELIQLSVFAVAA